MTKKQDAQYIFPTFDGEVYLNMNKNGEVQINKVTEAVLNRAKREGVELPTYTSRQAPQLYKRIMEVAQEKDAQVEKWSVINIAANEGQKVATIRLEANVKAWGKPRLTLYPANFTKSGKRAPNYKTSLIV